MNRIPAQLCFLLLGLILAGCAGGSSEMSGKGTLRLGPGGRAVAGARGEELHTYLSRLEALGFSGAVLIAQDGTVLLSQGYGAADRERAIPVSPQTVFSIGSITKPFTAAAILKLEMQGRLRVEDSIANYLPDVPPDKRAITIHHLLTHAAGLEENYGAGDFEPLGRRELVERILHSELLWEPGARYRYSNAGYSLLAAVIEIVTGETYEQYLRRQLLLPAGMRDTGYRLPDWDPRRVAQGYVGDERWGTVLERPWAEDGPYWNLRGNGGLHSTVLDLYRWHQALESDDILSPAAGEKMVTPHIAEDPAGFSHYGYGWAIFTTPRDTRLIAHNGGNGVFFADFRRYVDEDAVIILATNATDVDGEDVSAQLARIVFGMNYELPPAVAALDDSVLAALAGRYAVDEGGRLRVSRRRSGLWIAPEDSAGFRRLLAGEGDAEGEERLNAMRELLDAARDGDVAPLHAALGGRLPLEDVAAMERRVWENLRDRHGAFRRLEILGAAGGAPEWRTYARLHFERGDAVMIYHWEGPLLVGLRLDPDPPGLMVYPRTADRLVAFQINADSDLRVRVDRRETPPDLILEHGGERFRARYIAGR
ncbi:MAG: serine hydrolase [Candidatus Eisenbacteria bacterium]|nr:serine hydrolase [Candidatus Eisenbacteria bacterium]